jgi:hypothetical protein
MDKRATSLILDEVATERAAQNAKWGEQNHPDGTGPDRYWLLDDDPPAAEARDSYRQLTDERAQRGALTWLDIAIEEVAEAFAESGPAALRKELVQSAAVLVAWIEAIDRRP